MPVNASVRREAVADASLQAAPSTSVAEWLYGAVASLAFPLAWLGARVTGESRDALLARTGWMPDAHHPLVWFHGASAGEMAAAVRLAALLRGNGFAFTSGYTAANVGGVEFASRAGAQPQVATFAPWDSPRWVARAFDRWQPRALFLVETELWPRLILEAQCRGVPAFCVSARLYPRDVARYRVIRPLIEPALRRLALVLVQNDVERTRFVRIGADPARCVTAGNLKYLPDGRQRPDVSTLREELGIAAADPVVACGSVHGDEIPLIFAALEQLPLRGVRAIVAPRHASGVAAVVEQARRRGWDVCRRTDARRTARWRVLVLDTVGELNAVYAIASVAVIGGGFGRHGGHNPLEAVSAGTPVLFGAHFQHFACEAKALTATTPEAQVVNAAQLSRRLHAWLEDDCARANVLAAQRRALPNPEAIARRYLSVLSPVLRGRGLELA